MQCNIALVFITPKELLEITAKVSSLNNCNLTSRIERVKSVSSVV